MARVLAVLAPHGAQESSPGWSDSGTLGTRTASTRTAPERGRRNREAARSFRFHGAASGFPASPSGTARMGTTPDQGFPSVTPGYNPAPLPGLENTQARTWPNRTRPPRCYRGRIAAPPRTQCESLSRCSGLWTEETPWVPNPEHREKLSHSIPLGARILFGHRRIPACVPTGL